MQAIFRLALILKYQVCPLLILKTKSSNKNGVFYLFLKILKWFSFKYIYTVLIDLIWFIVFSVTFSNISAISCRPVYVVEEAGVSGENHRLWARNWQSLSQSYITVWSATMTTVIYNCVITMTTVIYNCVITMTTVIYNCVITMTTVIYSCVISYNDNCHI